MKELVFDITQESDGGFCAAARGEGIFTQGDTWDELRANVKDAVEGYFFDSTKPAAVRLHLVRDELLKTLEDTAKSRWHRACEAPLQAGPFAKATTLAATSCLIQTPLPKEGLLPRTPARRRRNIELHSQ